MEYEDPVQLADLLHRLTKRLRRAQAERLAPLTADDRKALVALLSLIDTDAENVST